MGEPVTEEMLRQWEEDAMPGSRVAARHHVGALVAEVRRLRAAGRCGSCRFMAAQREDDNARFGEYDSDAFEWKPSPHSTCVRIVHGNGGQKNAENFDKSAVVVDGSGYAARLLVLPSFGCVLWEAKAAEVSPPPPRSSTTTPPTRTTRSRPRP